MRAFGLHHVGVNDAAVIASLLPVGQHGVCDAGRATACDNASGCCVSHSLGMQHIERHRNDLALELCSAGTDISLQCVDVTKQAEGLGHVVVVLTVSAVVRARDLAGLPRSIFLDSHLLKLGQNL